MASRAKARAELEALRARVPVAERLAVDPLGFVPRDAPEHVQEIAAFLAAGLAVGHVKAIGRSVQRVLAHLDEPGRLGEQGHRWIRGHDIAAVVERLRALQAEHQSLGGAYAAGYVPGDAKASLTAFSSKLRDGLPATRGVKSLTASPVDGSACKRLNLFLRWMVRSDQVDLGLWTEISPADLIMPLDVHVLRFVARHRVTKRVTVGWRMAEEVTAWFRRLEPADPLRWDFAISHAGMMG